MRYFYFCSGETGMNRSGSLPNHENRNLYDGSPPSGLLLGTAAREFFLVTDPLRGCPVLGRRHSSYQIHSGVIISVLYLNTMIFMGNPGENSRNALGGFGKWCLSPPLLRQPPKYDKPRTGNTAFSHSAGAVRGTGFCPLHHSMFCL